MYIVPLVIAEVKSQQVIEVRRQQAAGMEDQRVQRRHALAGLQLQWLRLLRRLETGVKALVACWSSNATVGAFVGKVN